MASPDPAALLGLESAKLLDQPEAILAGHRKPETMAFTPPSEWSERLGRTAPSGPLGAALRDHVERHDTHSVGCSQPLDRHDEVSPAARAKVADDPAEGFLHRDSIGV